MIILRKIVAAASSILLVLLSTPAIVEGTCQCDEVCPDYKRFGINSGIPDTGPGDDDWDEPGVKPSCWKSKKKCFSAESIPECYAYCVCNWLGCNCDGCENTGITDAAAGSCGWSDGGCEEYGGYLGYNNLGFQTCYGDRVDDRRQMMDSKEEKDGCGDFKYFRSLSAEDKRNSLAEKYCGGEDQVVRQDIYTVLLHEILLTFDGISPSDVVAYIKTAGGIDQVLTCDLFNKAYGDLDHLRLCDDKHLSPSSHKTGKKQKKTP